MSKQHYLIYAAGPIAGHDYATAADWRLKLQNRLPLSCEVLTPMRGKEYLEAYREMPFTAEQLTSEGSDFRGDALDAEISSGRAIVKRDTWDVERCDIVFANLLAGDDAGSLSLGTACEIYLAAYLRKPVVTLTRKGSVHDKHPFVRDSSWAVVRTMEDALSAIRIALNLPPTYVGRKYEKPKSRL